MLKPRSVFSLAATVALLTVVAPGRLFSPSPAIAVTATFEMPTEVPTGTTIRVSSGSDAMTVISDALQTSFQDKFKGADVTVDAIGTDQAIGAVLNGNADLAAISRPLNDTEISQGLASEDVKRVKIAVIVGADNPFSDSLTSQQFAKIFRGEITNWSELGGSDAPIRLVDRPDVSDTRLSLAAYPVFKASEFATGSTATQVNTDSTADIIEQLGQDGISYALFDEVNGMAGVRILPMHQTLPTDARYPFSQPFSFIYKGEPSPGSAAFLGYAAGAPGQTALKTVNPFAGVVSAAGNTVTGAVDAAGAAGDAVKDAAGAAGDAVKGAAGAAGDIAGTAGDAVKGAAGTAGDAVKGAVDAAGDTAGTAVDAVQDTAGAAGDGAQGIADAAADQSVSDLNPTSQTRLNLWWLLLVPAACLGLVIWGERRRRKHVDTYTAHTTAEAPDVVQGIGKAGVAAGGAAAAAGGAAWSATKKTGNAAKDSLNTVGDAAKGGVGNIGQAAKSGLGVVKGGLDNAGDAAKGGLGAMKSGLDSAGDAAKEGAGAMDAGIKGGLDKAGNTLRDGADAVTGGVSGMADKTGDAIKSGTSTAKNAPKSLWDRVRDGVSDATDTVADKADDVANQAKQQADNVKDGARNMGQQGMDKASDIVDKLSNSDS